MYSVHPQAIEPLVKNIKRITQDKDLEAWGKVYAAFDATSQGPTFDPYSGTPTAPDRLTRIHYQSNLPDLSASEVPEWNSRSLRWLLRTYILSLSQFHLRGGWDKFASWFITNLWEELERKGGAEFEEHQLLTNVLFCPKHEFSSSLEVLQLKDTAFESFVSVPQLSTLIEMEDRVGLLRSLSREYRGASDGITRGLGKEMAMIEHFFRLLQLHNSSVYYFQWAT